MHEATMKFQARTGKRRQERYRLNRQLDFPLYVKTPESRLTALAVKDVSAAGVSIYVDKALPLATHVSVQFAAAPMQLEVQGAVAWCRPRHERDKEAEYAANAYVLGIELFSPLLLLSAFRDALPLDSLVLEDG